MKKILIVNKTFDLGGIQSSMVNMANELCQTYKVDLFVYNPSGVMKERLNDQVTVLKPTWRFQALGMSFREALKSKDARIVFFRLFATFWTKVFSNKLPIKCAIKRQPKLLGYDLAIAYHHEQKKKSVVSGFSRFVDECVESPKKVAWIHYDSEKVDLDSAYNNQFYKKMDKIVCVSQTLKASFAEKNPKLREKVDFCYNFLPYEQLVEKSKMPQKIPYADGSFICVSVCRLTPVKALVRAIRALADVLKQNKDVMWYIAGDGPERGNIEKEIQKNQLEDRVVLLGNQSNPYPYIKNADLMLNVSFHEAAPMTFLESLSLGTPILATRTSSVDELLTDRETSFICDNSIEGIRGLFGWIIENRNIVKNAKHKLNANALSNEGSLLKIKEYMA